VASDSDGDAPRAITRRGAGKHKADVDDLHVINLYAWFDAKKIVLPISAATNCRGIPTVKPTDVDACAMAATMAQLRGDVAKMNSQHDALCKHISEVTVAVNAVVDMKQQLDSVSTALAVTTVGHQGSNGTSKAETSQVGSYFFTDEDLSTQNDPAVDAPDDD